MTTDKLSVFSAIDYLGVSSASEVKWGHAVNSRAKLEECFTTKDKCMMLEADILLSQQGEAIMCHPPLRESDITFVEWLQAVVGRLETGGKGKLGIKLDFKEPGALLPCLTELKRRHDENDCVKELSERGCVWINYDVLQGPCGVAPHFDPHECIPLTKQHFPLAYFSLGWTTGFQATGGCVPYSQYNVCEMLGLCRKYNIVAATFPVRASLVKSSWDDALSALIFNNEEDTVRTEHFSITIWHSKVDQNELDLSDWLYHRILSRLKDEKASHHILTTRFWFDLGG